MRVATRTIYDMVKFNLARITEQLNRANRVATTGKRIATPSDDPTGLQQTLNIRSGVSNIGQIRRNINMGKAWLAASESALNNILDLISDTKALSVQMSTSTTNAEQRALAAKDVQNALKEIISLANTEIDGRYIFSGSKTDTAPFDQDGTYHGDGNGFKIKIGRDATVEVGSAGSDVFQPSGAGNNGDIFRTMNDLKNALEADNVPGIQQAIENLDDLFNHVSVKISDIGSKMKRMEVKENILQDLKIANTERLAGIEDADITEAITDLRAKELAYQAALASSAQVMKLSLVDYL